MPVFYGETIESPLLLGTSLYPSPAIMAEAVRASACDIVTVSLRRESGSARAGQDFWGFIRDLGVRVLPNTAGCHSVREAVTTAKMAREVFGTPWVKLEVINDAETLAPDVFGLVEAARILSAEGFQVFPYCTEDLGVAERLVEAGCEVLMPWGAPIGSARGLNNVYGLPLPSRAFPGHAARGRCPASACPPMRRRPWSSATDAVLLNTAVAKAGDPVAHGPVPSHRPRRPDASPSRPGRWSPRDMGCPLHARSRKGFSGMTALDRFYPIVDSAAWIDRIVPLGVRLVQLRIKDRSPAELRAEIRAAETTCLANDCLLVVNDYWQLAIEEGCRFVHLGQEDLADADVGAIRRAGLGLGLSSHDGEELETGACRFAGLHRARAGLSDHPEEDEVGARRGWKSSATGSAGSATSRSSPSAA